MRSTASSVSRRPAVSTTVSGMPAISITRSTGSRVVPGIGVTIAASSRASALSRLDLPTFGSPTSTTVRPSRSSAPVRACASTCASCARRSASRRSTSPARRNSTSSSGKSSVASVYIRSSVRPSTSAWISRENAPARLRAAARAAVAVAASIRSATLSACARSSLPFRYARFVNSPGSASRAPSSTQRASTSRSTDGPPWPWNSTTASPVYDAGAGKWRTRPWSSGAPAPSRNVATVATRGGGTRPATPSISARSSAPETRTMPTPPRPGGVAIAAIVSGAGGVADRSSS